MVPADACDAAGRRLGPYRRQILQKRLSSRRVGRNVQAGVEEIFPDSNTIAGEHRPRHRPLMGSPVAVLPSQQNAPILAAIIPSARDGLDRTADVYGRLVRIYRPPP